jgi:hypothetical protein
MMVQETARFCHRLGFVSVLTHGQQLDIDVQDIDYDILEAIKESKTAIEMLRAERQDESV